ncbi:hypothetical protein F3Y22_tig00110210pilonHSYRG00166 [Hibiscus syriacus]|uniref:DUF7745 domain-containing protein n=1 Tax=Hibiscus syriacus TaxID=106335 RepID=A0A6A3BEE6_HIBSY|nr:hypothetical protein F3Y22_tig00110210pilonHSYRG00166 [Hibiscus syriacus]
MDKGVVIQEIKNPEVQLWSEKIQKEKGDNLQGSYVSELVSYTSISRKQNDVQELRDIWGSWKNDWKQKFSRRYGDIALLLHVKTDEPLIRALVRFWNPGYSCFTFNQEDMVPTIEEYTTLLHCESIKLERAYIKHIKSQPFKNRLAKIAGVDEKWVTDRLRNKGLYGLIIFPNILGCIDVAVVELFEQLPKRVKPTPTILAETFQSLNHCRRAGGGRFIGCVQLLQVWIHSHFWNTNGVVYRRFSTTYSPLREFITMKWHEGTSKEKWMKVFTHLSRPRYYLESPLYGARQFVPATCELDRSEFEYHGHSYKKMIKEAVDSWKKVFRMDVVAAKNMLTPDYVEWQRLRKNDNILVPDYVDSQKDRAGKLEREQKRVCLELEDLRKGYQDKVKDNSKLKVAYKYWNERVWKEQMKTTQRRLASSQHQNQCLRIRMADLEKQHERDGKTIADLEAIVDGFKKQARKLQIVPFNGCLQWRFRWEQAQQRVKARDTVIRDFLDQVQKAARHLHGLAREAGMVRQGIQPVTDEDRRLVNLLEVIRGLEDLV